jgi:hypothetical protein
LAQDGTEPPPIPREPEMEELEEGVPELEPQEVSRPVARAARIETGEAPVIDGNLSDLSWAKATVVDDIRQRQPDPGAPATERTVVRIMYDANNIYFSVYAYDSEPDQVIARSRARDGQIVTGDNIQIALDPGLTRRNSYVFMMGPSGGRFDALRLNNLEELPQWDTLWEGRAMRVPDGWVAEIAIPFRNLSYEPGQTDWGFEFTRYIRRKAEIVRWSSVNPAIELTDVSEAGTLTGITAVTPGLGLDVQPYVVLRAQHDWSLPDDGAGISGTGGGNIYYRITPALTGTLTFNPDFSDAPLDIREVNTTRFSLFLPETRDFFLQDAGNFEFGGRPFRRTANDRQSNNARPFFSRNLGLVEGRPVSLIAGGKLSGEFAGFNIGAFSVLSDETPTSPGQVLSVARITHPIFSQSRFGFIFTTGDPTGLTRNTVAGVDFNYRPSEVFEMEASYQPNFIRLPTGNVDIHVGTIDAIVNFTPDMQFAMQTQYDNISGSFGFLGRYRWEFRPGTELFVALGQSAFIPGTTIHQGMPPEIQTTTLSVRLGRTFQF